MSWISAVVLALSLSVQPAETASEEIPIAGDPLGAEELRDGGPFRALIVDIIRDEDGTPIAYSGAFGVFLEQTLPDPRPTTFRPFQLSVDELGLQPIEAYRSMPPGEPAYVEVRSEGLLKTRELYTIVWEELRGRFVALDHHIRSFAFADPSAWYCGVNVCRHPTAQQIRSQDCDRPPFNGYGAPRRLILTRDNFDLEVELSVQFHGCEAAILLADDDIIAAAAIDRVSEVEGGLKLEMRHYNDPLECSLRVLANEGPRYRFACVRWRGVEMRPDVGLLMEPGYVDPTGDVSSP